MGEEGEEGFMRETRGLKGDTVRGITNRTEVKQISKSKEDRTGGH